MTTSLPRLYDEFATWWPLLSAPADYAEEAAFFRDTLMTAGAEPPRTLLELGLTDLHRCCDCRRGITLVVLEARKGVGRPTREPVLRTGGSTAP